MDSIEFISPPFEFIRTHKACSAETQILVLKKNAGRLNAVQMLECFENGVAGKYGKFLHADAQTLIGWINTYIRERESAKHYLEHGLLPTSSTFGDENYLQSTREWQQEVNRCYQAFTNGVHERNFHAHCYDRMVIDGLIPVDACKQFFECEVTTQNCDEPEINQMIARAKQQALKKTFARVKKDGFNQVYNLKT